MIKKFYIVSIILFASICSAQQDLSDLSNQELIKLAKSINVKQVTQGIVNLTDRSDYCWRNHRKPLSLPDNFDFYGLDDQGKKNLISLANFYLDDTCNKRAREDFRTILVANKLEQRKEFLTLIQPRLNSELAEFKRLHEVEFQRFMKLINLSDEYGQFDAIATMQALHLLDF